MAFCLQVIDESHRAALAIFLGLECGVRTGILEHRQIVQWDVGTTPCIGRRGQVVGIGLTGHLENGHSNFFSHLWTAREPLGICPALHHCLGAGVARFDFLSHVMESIEHQQRIFQRISGRCCNCRAVEQINQRLHVVTAEHRTQQLRGFDL